MSDHEGYSHTQHGYLHVIIYLSAGLFFFGIWLTRFETWISLIIVIALIITLFCGAAMHYMTVSDGGGLLKIRYGPYRLLKKDIPYADITSAEIGKTNIIDGWGIHWIPLRGWTYNLWGRDCVEMTVKGKRARVGTDDPENLLKLLQSKIKS